MIRYAHIASPLGAIRAIARDGYITGLHFVDGKYVPPVEADWHEEPESAPLKACADQLADYFAGRRARFDLPIAFEGTDFQLRIWTQIARVPSGRTITYAELAEKAGVPGSARAAGAATGRNPISIVIPCHRIVGSDGSLTGYAGGLDRKTRLLALEGVKQRALA